MPSENSERHFYKHIDLSLYYMRIQIIITDQVDLILYTSYRTSRGNTRLVKI